MSKDKSKALPPLEFDELQLENLADNSAGGRPLLDVLAEDFFMHGRELVDLIRQNAFTGDIENMRDFAHALRSPSSTLGLLALSQICADLEERDFEFSELHFKLQELETHFISAGQWLRSRQRLSKVS